ncbi:MAG TPA: O-antigen ligase family protein [Candidatus Acidoferrum sp.]|nr:O-antigen ligase family protein [Candidatus Acidoferrum sp.]
MTGTDRTSLFRSLTIFYLLFVIGSTFSRAVAQISLGFALGIFLIVIITEHHQPLVKSLKWFYVFVGLYIGWLLVAAVFSKDPAHSLYFTRKEWLFVAVPIGVYLFQNEKIRSRVITALAIGVSVVSVYAMIEFYTGTHWLNMEGWNFVPIPVEYVAGTFFRPLEFANYYATAAILILGWVAGGSAQWDRKQKLLIAAATLAMLAAVLTFRRGPTIYMAVGLIIIMIVKRKSWLWYGASVLAAAIIMSAALPEVRTRYTSDMTWDASSAYEGSRLFIWKNSLALIERSPLFGVGNGNFMGEYREQVGPKVKEVYVHGHSHNDIINTAAIGGIPCALFFMAIWWFIFRRIWRGWRDPSFSETDRRLLFVSLVAALVYFLTSLTESSFAHEETHELVVVIWAMGLAPWYNVAVPEGVRTGRQKT